MLGLAIADTDDYNEMVVLVEFILRENLLDFVKNPCLGLCKKIVKL